LLDLQQHPAQDWALADQPVEAAADKGHPGFPDQPCADLDEARAWTHRFAHGYNTEHRHSGLKFVTPAQRHQGEDIDLLARRHALYQAARARHPERWTGRGDAQLVAGVEGPPQSRKTP
jgi:hypothetical protein